MQPVAMPVIALLILTALWVLGGVVAMAVCRAAAEGDRADADAAPAMAPSSRRFAGPGTSRP
jgi:hypothetical protein